MHASLFAALVTICLGSLVASTLVFVNKGRVSDADLAHLFGASGKRDRDLSIIGSSTDSYLLVQVLSVFLAVGVAVTVLGLVGVGLLGIFLALISLGLGFSGPRLWLHSRLVGERQQMATAVGTLEELSAVAVAGGSEIGFALRTAAGLGNGRSWKRLRAAAHASLYSTSTFSNELTKLADVYESGELRNLANLLAVTEDGGLSQNSLEELAQSQARSEARAKMDRAEKNLSLMVIPVGLLFGSFALFIGLLVSHVLSEVQI